MISDTTAVLLAVGPAAVTATAGYSAARLQARTSLHELEHQVRDKRRDERLAAFSELLTSEVEFQACVRSDRMTPEWWQEFLGSRWGPAYARVILVTESEQTKQFAGGVMNLIQSVAAAADESDGVNYAEAARVHLLGQRKEIQIGRSQLLKAMREELGSG